jgi:hypothetical protein
MQTISENVFIEKFWGEAFTQLRKAWKDEMLLLSKCNLVYLVHNGRATYIPFQPFTLMAAREGYTKWDMG